MPKREWVDVECCVSQFSEPKIDSFVKVSGEGRRTGSDSDIVRSRESHSCDQFAH
jgi:hypothetical protein